MSLFEIGRLAIKIAGRDAGKTCVIVDEIDGRFVLIDGQSRRKKCNVKHLEPLPQILKLRKNASPEEVKAEFQKLGLEKRETKPKPQTARPKKQRKEKLAARQDERKKIESEEKEAKEEKVKDKKASSFEEAVEKASPKESPEEKKE